ncbi:DMT family transporter [Arthrobacter agilis]|uniref:DMT family transporter n=1 Tax=Arthrobacter agilis TaxID=37921 RepID=UPI00277F9C34|nr:DMT family transporter [Arthrobacter agilis]MDQ0736669.1 drug/metabolite transporter (DMT)-like permease [Arthrobacter agilis]
MTIFLSILGVIGVSASGPIMAATAAPVLAIAFWRNLLGALLMGGPAAVSKRAEFAALTSADLRRLAIAATALALHFACFITALKLTSVAAATALVCLQVAWIALFDALRGSRPQKAVVAGLGVAFIGVVVITGFDLSLSPDALLGDVLALAGGALAGVYQMAGASARRTLSTGTYTTLCYGACAVILLVLCAVTRQPIVGFPPAAWAGILAVTLMAQIMGHSVFNHLLAVMSPLVVSMIILLEIPGAAILAAVFLEETLPAGTYGGLALILVGLAVVIRGQQRRRGRRPLAEEAAAGPPPGLGGE